MSNFIFNEENEAKHLYENGFEDGIDYKKIYMVAKYIRQNFRYGKIRLEKVLIEFCKNQDSTFNPVIEANSIRRWINSAMQYNLRKVESVGICQKEIEFLATVQKSKDRKLLFCALVLSKALKKSNTRRKKKEQKQSIYYYLHYRNFMDIIHLSNLNNVSESDLADVFHTYQENFTFYNPARELIRLNYIDGQSKPTVIVDDFDNLISIYNILFEQNKPPGVCERCQKSIIKNSNTQKYCKDCSKIIRNEQQKLLMRKRRLLAN